MKEIRFKNISKSYGDTKIVNSLDLTINAGERLVLLGPSGCGKSTTLRMIAGLEEITSGDMYFGDERINDVEAGDRGIAMVFQNYALYPHLTVWDNITFGLRMNGVDKKEIEKRTTEVVKILNLQGLEKRYPKELSGGQRQRVALGRAAVKNSDFFLLDEPLSNLDVQLRNTSREELVKLHEINRPTFIYVTHDQIEAMTIGHRIAILNKGDLQQIDTPEEVYKNPANIFVAKFIGTPPMNILTSKVADGQIYIEDSFVSADIENIPNLNNRNLVYLGIRPEHMIVHKDDGLGRVQGEVIRIENYGNQKCVSVKIGNENIKASIKNEQDIKKHEKVYLEIDVKKCSYFDVKTEKNLILEGK
ncbi:MAG: ABC transporter ATP-binding protein [Cetobacterium sp.]